jgi:hypothetical protein
MNPGEWSADLDLNHDLEVVSLDEASTAALEAGLRQAAAELED